MAPPAKKKQARGRDAPRLTGPQPGGRAKQALAQQQEPQEQPIQPSVSGSGRAAGPAIPLVGWNPQQVQRAVTSLQKYLGEQQGAATTLLDDDELVYLLISLKKMPQGPRKDKLVRIAVPHPLYDAEGAEVCLFVKDHKGEGAKAAKKRLERFQKKGGVAKVVGLHKLRTKYESHEAKRQLCAAYDFFLADERVLPSLPKLIGKSFFRKRKQPVPVDLRSPSFPEQVKAALAATYMSPPAGTSVTLRVGRASMSSAELEANIAAALAGAVARIPKKWANVQGVYLKAAESVALPVWQTLPDQPARIDAA